MSYLYDKICQTVKIELNKDKSIKTIFFGDKAKIGFIEFYVNGKFDREFYYVKGKMIMSQEEFLKCF